jgi:uncharacterized protein
MMNILLSGGTGLVGRALVPLLLEKGHQVANLTTRSELDGTWQNGLRHVWWNPALQEIKAQETEWADGVINLAGYSVAHRWTRENKNRMIASRIDSAELLMRTIRKSASPPAWMISTSASGYYGSSPEWVDENSPPGEGFLADLCRNWEDVCARLDETATRKIIMRIGVVLDSGEGALARMLPLFRAGLGAPVGSGKQWISWIHIQDLARAIVHLAESANASGVYNLASPNPVTNTGFSAHLAEVLGKSILLPKVPSLLMKLLYGEMASLVLDSQKMRTERLQRTGFEFRYPEVRQALTHLLT